MPSSFHSLYLSSGQRANAFLPRGFGDLEDRRARVNLASARRVEPSLLSILAEQNAALPRSEARRANVEALGRAGTVVVATGQQVGLFLGPLYTVYKAATAVAIARKLTAETGVRAVPLFWLQTEDHDFAEIAACTVPREKTQPLRVSLAGSPAEERISIVDRLLGDEVPALVDALEQALGDQPHFLEVSKLVREHYRPGVSPGRAFAGVLAALFADDGLVFYDPRQATAARLLAPVMRRVIAEAGKLESLLTERGHALRAAGFDEQIALRPGSPLAFFHLDGERGPRHRLVRRGDRFEAPGGASFSESELLEVLERQPLRFSTSALLRPIAQDTLFPTAVYVGGPSEVDYFAQLAPLYAAFGLDPPLVAHRARFRLVPPRIRTLLNRLELTGAELDQPHDALLKRLAASMPAPEPGAAPELSWAGELEARLEELSKTAPSIDPGLARAVARTRRTVRHSMERLSRRYQRLAVEREQVAAGRLSQIASWLRPDGAPQERVFSFPWFAARMGLAGFHRAIASVLDPFDPAVREVDL